MKFRRYCHEDPSRLLRCFPNRSSSGAGRDLLLGRELPAALLWFMGRHSVFPVRSPLPALAVTSNTHLLAACYFSILGKARIPFQGCWKTALGEG